MQTSALVFACNSAVCAPPPVGHGGSLRAQGAVARIATKLALRGQHARDALLQGRANSPTERNSVGEVTHVSGIGQVTVRKVRPESLQPGDTILHKLRSWRVHALERGSYVGERIITLRDRNGNEDRKVASQSDIINVIRK